MSVKGYVLLLLEESQFRYGTDQIGYWDGKVYFREETVFPGVLSDKYNEKVKVYKSKKTAENAVKKLKGKFPYIRDAEIIPLD